MDDLITVKKLALKLDMNYGTVTHHLRKHNIRPVKIIKTKAKGVAGTLVPFLKQEYLYNEEQVTTLILSLNIKKNPRKW